MTPRSRELKVFMCLVEMPCLPRRFSLPSKTRANTAWNTPIPWLPVSVWCVLGHLPLFWRWQHLWRRFQFRNSGVVLQNCHCSSSDLIPHREVQMNILVLFSRKIILLYFLFFFFNPNGIPNTTPIPVSSRQEHWEPSRAVQGGTAGGMSREPAPSCGCVPSLSMLHLQQDCSVPSSFVPQNPFAPQWIPQHRKWGDISFGDEQQLVVIF